MNHDLIHKWLQGKRNFTVGTILYKRYGNDEALKNLFEEGKTAYTESKLLEELKAIVEEAKKPVKEKYASSSVFPPGDKVINALKDRWMPLYTEMNYKRHALDKFLNQKTDAATRRRGKLAMEILNLEKQCMKIWADRDHYLEFGKLPSHEIDEAPIVDPLKLVERYKNVQGYIRRYKMYLRKNPGDPKNIALLAQYEKEFAALKKKRI